MDGVNWPWPRAVNGGDVDVAGTMATAIMPAADADADGAVAIAAVVDAVAAAVAIVVNEDDAVHPRTMASTWVVARVRE